MPRVSATKPPPVEDYDEGEMFTPQKAPAHPWNSSSPIPTSNPLAKYFRVPGVHVKIPSQGYFMPPGSVEFTMTGDIPVYPVRASDELLLKSPDALMSGYAIEELLKSCVPAIKMPRLLSNPDLDALLIAIYAATHGEVMALTTACPKCGEENHTHRNLAYLLTNMRLMERENVIRLTDELLIYLRPYNLNNTTKIGVASFEEARKLQALEHSDEPDSVKSETMNNSMKRIAALTREAMADCIIKVVTPDGEVVDGRMILEFIVDMSKVWSDAIQKKLEDLNNRGIDKKYEIICSECEHTWNAEIEFNPSTFFVVSS